MSTKKFYVYALCYPDDTPFYIGKGSGNRIESHIKGYHPHSNKACHNIIQSLHHNGEEVKVRIFFQTDDENEAYKMEKRFVVQFHYVGLANKILLPKHKNTADRLAALRSVNTKIEERILDGIAKYRGKYSAYNNSIYRSYNDLLLHALRDLLTPEEAPKIHEDYDALTGK